VLGPLQVSSDARVLTITAHKDRLLIAELLVHANRLVSTEHLADSLWSEDMPANPANAVQVRVSRLRSLLRRGTDDPRFEDVVVTRPGGYLLDLTDVTVDSVDFQGLLRQARRTTDHHERAAMLSRANDLWRGPAFGDLHGSVCIAGELLRLEETRLATLEELHASELALGRHLEVIPELASMVESFPLRERPRVQLMLALYRAGRTADALRLYQDARDLLGNSLGLDPGSELRRMHEAILAEDPSLEPPALAVSAFQPTASLADQQPAGERFAQAGAAHGATSTATDGLGAAGTPPRSAVDGLSARQVRPYQLPPAVATFTGRTAELDQILGILRGPEAGGTRVAAVYGPGGTGKSSLVIQVAHRVAEDFPDGLLYIDLRGYTPGLEPLGPLEALTRLLESLGAPSTEVPETLADARARYAAITATARLLVILDDAADTAQLTPLMPAGPECAALVTSRHPMSGLDGTVHLRLTGLPSTEAVELLSRLVGAERAAVDPPAVRELAELCEGLPLALRIAGTRLATRPTWPVAALVNRLADEQRRLDELHVADLAVRGSIELSYRELASDGDELITLQIVASLPLRDITPEVAAAVLGLRPSRVENALERLVDAQLLESPVPDRYRMHDLTRIAVRELGAGSDSAAREERLLGAACACYRDLALRANSRLPRADDGTHDEESTGTPDFIAHTRSAVAEGYGGHAGRAGDEALAWFDSERENILRLVRAAAALGTPPVRPALALARAALHPLKLDLRLYDLRTLSDAWLALADSFGERAERADALDLMGFAQVMLGRQREALAPLQASLTIRRELGDQAKQAQSWGNLGLVNHYRGEFDEAARCMRHALALYRTLRCSRGVGDNWNNLGEIRFGQGDYRKAIFCYERAGEYYELAGDREGSATALANRGAALLRLGDVAAAAPLLERAERAHLASGDREGLGIVRTVLSELHRRRGNLGLAVELVGETLELAHRGGWVDGEWRARYALGRALIDLGQTDTGRRELLRARELMRPASRPDIAAIDALLAS
jgi:DNA-binding SARP family transcriptional activator